MRCQQRVVVAALAGEVDDPGAGQRRAAREVVGPAVAVRGRRRREHAVLAGDVHEAGVVVAQRQVPRRAGRLVTRVEPP